MKKVVALLLVFMLVLGAIATAIGVLGPMFTEDEPSSVQQIPRDGTMKPFYDQEIDWTECSERLECGWLRVPLDHDDPDGERINLAVVKKLATQQPAARGSLVVNPGGPGAPGSEMAVQAALIFQPEITKVYDVVGFDPRGTGNSTAIDCLSDTELDAFVASDPTPEGAAQVEAAQAASAEFAQGCREKSGELVEHVSTVDVARDMDVLRAVLGQDTLDYYGASYGTKLGATYAELHADKVGRFVLDAALDPAVGQLDASLTQAEGFEVALRAYVENCQKAKACPLEGDVDAGAGKVAELITGLEKEPLPAGERELHAGQAFYGVVLPLYQESYWPMLTAALKSAFKGEGKQLLDLSDLYTARQADGSYRDNSMEAIGVINCLDDPWSIPYDEVPDYFDRFDKASPTFGRLFAWGLTACAGFDFEAPEKLEITGAGAAPILVTGTTRDPATPIRWAESLSTSLESAVLIRREGDGHGAYNVGNSCVDDAVNDYLVEGKVPSGTLDC